MVPALTCVVVVSATTEGVDEDRDDEVVEVVLGYGEVEGTLGVVEVEVEVGLNLEDGVPVEVVEPGAVLVKLSEEETNVSRVLQSPRQGPWRIYKGVSRTT